MKKVYSIFILTLMLVSTYALHPAILLMRHVVREHMEENIKKNIPENELTVFVDPQNNKEVFWETLNEEFHYKGRMYDVARVKNKNGRLYYYCLNDKKEAGLCNLADNILGKQNDSKHHPGTTDTENLLKLLAQTFIPAGINTSYITCIQAGQKYSYGIYACYYSHCYKKATAPPPWMA